MKTPRKRSPKPLFVLERTLFPWKKAEIYESKQPKGKYQLWKLTCDWKPYDDLDYTTSETIVHDTLQSAVLDAKKFVETVDY